MIHKDPDVLEKQSGAHRIRIHFCFRGIVVIFATLNKNIATIDNGVASGLV